ncbi:CheR family methyltransferase [Halanaerobacter jeridensis]|uniref:protein-glutamate O-methyltransferase n=1 Tax=Halanaerobacter jeridensis TaxID=706427 RepID=A0A938XNK5_9FIRM|nr:chemotaxis protein methyltransferase CheR [Halanaerobacter jeridensis]
MQEISEKIFNHISDLIYQEIGVHLPQKKKAMVNSRLSKRIRKLGLQDFEDYCQYLENNKQELLHLFNTLTTNVTHFFREKHHFDFLCNNVLPQVKDEKAGKKVRGWSAGCSSGEEAYTLAILLSEFFNQSWDTKILATDINTEVLNAAQKGIYHQRQVKKVPYELLTKYFQLGTGENKGLFKVKSKLKKLVQFRRSNLNQNQYPIKSKLDFIFCRNVFIYFNDKTQNKILNRFHKHLKPEGYLFLGHSESINTEEREGKWESVYKTVYQKRRR